MGEPSNAELMQSMLAMIAQQQDMMRKMAEATTLKDLRLDAVKAPRYSGQMQESFALFKEQVQQYFEVRRVEWKSATMAATIIPTIGSMLTGTAADWYVWSRSRINTVDELFFHIEQEFVPADLQIRLRDQLRNLNQAQCRDLGDFVNRFRQLMIQVRNMSDVDSVFYFTQGLKHQTRAEVEYRRCSSLSQAINVAYDFERSHFGVGSSRRTQQFRRPERTTHQRFDDPQPEPMEIDNVQVVSREECFQRNLCFYCKKPGHRLAECPTRPRTRSVSRPRARVSMIEDVQDTAESSDEAIVFDQFTVNTLQNNGVNYRPHLLRKTGSIDGVPVLILLDCGASTNVIRPGLATKVLRSQRGQLKRFDGSLTPPADLATVEATVRTNEGEFSNMIFTETHLDAEQDVIFGLPWFQEYAPQINWTSGQLLLPNQPHISDMDSTERTELTPDSTISRSGGQLHRSYVRRSDYAELFVVKIASNLVDDNVPDWLCDLIQEYTDIFPAKLPDGLPPPRAVQFDVEMKPDAIPSSRAPFRLSKTEQEALNSFVADNLKKGWVEVSNSPWVSNIFGIPKKDHVTGQAPTRGEWLRSGNSLQPIRWVIDYRYVNSQTKIPKIPLPHIEELFDRMAGCAVFTVIDLAQGYHQMLVNTSSRQYTAFRTHKETYQWCVAPMGLAGMPGVWSRLMRELFDKFDFAVVYLDDICIFSKTNADHKIHLRQVFQVLRREQLYAHRGKCSFGRDSVQFLGHTVSRDGLSVDQRKTSAIATMAHPTSRKELLSFLGLAGYYRRFICDFAKMALPLSKLVKKDVPWAWSEDQDEAFQSLKVALQQAPVLQLPDFSIPFIVTTDASGLCMGGVLSQLTGGEDHPIAFFSKKFGVHEQGWPAHEQELLAIKTALAKWRHYLHGRSFDVYTDNNACRWMLHHPNVTPKMARMLTFFSQFNFTLHHVKGTSNMVADALSRPSVTRPALTSSESIVPHVHDCGSLCAHRDAHLRRHRIHLAVLCMLPSLDKDLLLDVQDFEGVERVHQVGVPQKHQRKIHEEVQHIEFIISSIHLSSASKKAFIQGYNKDHEFTEALSTNHDKYVLDDGLLYLRTNHAVKRLCVPADDRLITSIIREHHDGNTAAHPGVRRTQLKVAQWYFWPRLEMDVREYVQSCGTCTRWKTSTLKKNGKLMPIPVPEECWEVVSMDFVTGLPVSRGFDAIMTVVDKLSKRPRYAPTHTNTDAPKVANLFFDVVVRHHGLPKVIISDRDPKFTSNFWKSLMTIMGTKLSMTTAHRAQADGQTERQNLILEDALRCMVSYHGDDWATHLGTIEFAHATLVSKSTQLSPFEIDTGRQVSNAIAGSFSVTGKQLPVAEYAKKFADRRQKIIKLAQTNLAKAQEKQKNYYDKKRSNVTFTTGDMVMLDAKHLKLRHHNMGTGTSKTKLLAKKIGPFKIETMINSNVARLVLPRSLRKLHPSFNIDLLSHFVPNPTRFSGRPIPKAVPVILDEETGSELHIVEALVKKRVYNKKNEWLVRWHGLPVHECTWEKEQNIRHVAHWQDLVQDFKIRQREMLSGRM